MEVWTKTVWQDVTWESPPEWEILRFSSNEKSGGCVLVDRYEERLKVIWNRPVRSPDVERMVNDQRSREEAEDGVELSDADLPPGWYGYWIAGGRYGIGLTRAARWYGQDETLIEIDLAWTVDQERNRSLEHRILSGISVDTRSLLAHWRAFGIDVHLSRDCKLKECRVEPGKTHLRFETGKKGPVWEIRRIGLPDLWLKEPLREWLHRIVETLRFQVSSDLPPEEIAGQHIEWLDSRRRKEGFSGLLGSGVWRRDAAWHCRPANRIFHVTLTTERRNELELARIDLRCACGTHFIQERTS